MEQTGIVIGKESWMLLRGEPLYSARFIDRQGTDELVVLVRVEDLDWFLGVQPPLTVDLTTHRSSRGVWVVEIAYQLYPTFGDTKGGIFYLNPRQNSEAELVRKLLQQEALPVVFLSEDCAAHYTMKVPLDPRTLARWRQAIEQIHESSGGEYIDGDDPEFAAVVWELQTVFRKNLCLSP